MLQILNASAAKSEWGFLKGTEELHHWDFNAAGIILVKLLGKSVDFHRSRLPSIFFFWFCSCRLSRFEVIFYDHESYSCI